MQINIYKIGTCISSMPAFHHFTIKFKLILKILSRIVLEWFTRILNCTPKSTPHPNYKFLSYTRRANFKTWCEICLHCSRDNRQLSSKSQCLGSRKELSALISYFSPGSIFGRWSQICSRSRRNAHSLSGTDRPRPALGYACI